ncbi:MAG: hypothetical protein ACYTBJ_05700 [Planctomycetota bacterium]
MADVVVNSVNQDMFKIGTAYGPDDVEFRYSNIYQRQDYPQWSRIAIGAQTDHVSLMLEIAKSWAGPYGVLYVLVLSRMDHAHARYQAPRPCDYEQLESFASRFRPYLEKDARHNLWIMDVNSPFQLVYDRHNIIYAYGDQTSVISLLTQDGFIEAQVKIPSPHTHYYHPEFDDAEDDIITYWDWKPFPLQDTDNP